MKQKEVREKEINIREQLDKEIAKHGVGMSKLISSAYSGFFFYKPATYDNRTVYSSDELYQLTREGFSINDAGKLICLILDAIFH